MARHSDSFFISDSFLEYNCLQCSVRVCCPVKWIGYMCTHILSLLRLPFTSPTHLTFLKCESYIPKTSNGWAYVLPSVYTFSPLDPSSERPSQGSSAWPPTPSASQLVWSFSLGFRPLMVCDLTHVKRVGQHAHLKHIPWEVGKKLA